MIWYVNINWIRKREEIFQILGIQTYSSFSQLLLRREDHSPASRATLSFGCLDTRGVGVVVWTVSGDLLLTTKNKHIHLKSVAQ